jgi:hypothetical protein
MSFEAFLFCTGLIIGGLIGFLAGKVEGAGERARALDHACGECDHVGECGDYECRPGVDGWRLTAQCNPDVDMCGGCEACVELKRNQLDYALSHAAEERCAARADLDAARARIAELEAQAARLDQLLRDEKLGHTKAAMSLHRCNVAEAAHLAHIKALRACCHGLVHDVDRLMCGIDVGRHAMLMRSTLADTAHYDVEGEKAPCTHGARTWNVIDQTMRCKVCDDAKAGAR